MAGRPGLDIVSFAAGGTWAIQDGWVSPRYADRQLSKVATFSVRQSGDVDIVTYLLPRTQERFEVLPAKHPSQRGLAYEMKLDGDVSEIFVLGDGGIVSAGGIDGDAEWVWARRRNGVVDCLVVFAASRLEIDNASILRADGPVHLIAEHVEGRWRVTNIGRAAIVVESSQAGQLVQSHEELTCAINQTIVISSSPIAS